MMKSFRTYRLLRVIVAATLVLGVTLPLVRYACAMTGLSITVPSMPMASMCPKYDAQPAQPMRGCHGPAAHLCPDDESCPHAEQCRAGTHTAEDNTCCSSESVRAEQALKVDMKQHTLQVVLPLLAVLTDIEAPSPTRISFPEYVVSRMAGGGVPIYVLHTSFLL